MPRHSGGINRHLAKQAGLDGEDHAGRIFAPDRTQGPARTATSSAHQDYRWWATLQAARRAVLACRDLTPRSVTTDVDTSLGMTVAMQAWWMSNRWHPVMASTGLRVEHGLVQTPEVGELAVGREGAGDVGRTGNRPQRRHPPAARRRSARTGIAHPV